MHERQSHVAVSSRHLRGASKASGKRVLGRRVHVLPATLLRHDDEPRLSRWFIVVTLGGAVPNRETVHKSNTPASASAVIRCKSWDWKAAQSSAAHAAAGRCCSQDCRLPAIQLSPSLPRALECNTSYCWRYSIAAAMSTERCSQTGGTASSPAEPTNERSSGTSHQAAAIAAARTVSAPVALPCVWQTCPAVSA